ncbi:MAG: SDR family oxidoreductase [Azospirillaceae bacterium]|nr:SDR family oxidoreductase [Azospirillaceae bacterium]
MRVFVTGASGFVGSAVVPELLAAGHQVLGLARSDASAAAVAASGAAVHRGSLEDLDSLRQGAAAADAVIHTAFIHDFTKFAENCATDRKVIAALGAGLAGTGRPLLITSGTALLNPGAVSTEDIVPTLKTHPIPRVATEEAAADLMAQGLNVRIVRLPPSVHGDGDHGFMHILINLAREKGVAAYIGDGDNRWPGVHRLDAARLYRLALEKGAAGARYHATEGEGVPFREIAGIIGRRLGLPVVSLSREEAGAHFGWFSHFAAIDAPVSSEWTRAQLGWQPTQIGLLADLDRPAYFGG